MIFYFLENSFFSQELLLEEKRLKEQKKDDETLVNNLFNLLTIKNLAILSSHSKQIVIQKVLN